MAGFYEIEEAEPPSHCHACGRVTWPAEACACCGKTTCPKCLTPCGAAFDCPDCTAALLAFSALPEEEQQRLGC